MPTPSEGANPLEGAENGGDGLYSPIVGGRLIVPKAMGELEGFETKHEGQQQSSGRRQVDLRVIGIPNDGDWGYGR